MLLSLEKNFLFIHIPKTAGTSVRKCLRPYALTPEQCWENRALSHVGIHVNLFGPWKRKKFRNHCRASDVQTHIPGNVFDELFKFTFVRNPWDMLVSLYHFIPTRPAHRHSRRCAQMTFAQFVDEWTQRPETAQWTRILDHKGKQLINFVGRYERLREDFERICAFIGIECTLPITNRSRHNDYREYYTPQLEQLVATRLARDVELFDYKFTPETFIPAKSQLRFAA